MVSSVPVKLAKSILLANYVTNQVNYAAAVWYKSKVAQNLNVE